MLTSKWMLLFLSVSQTPKYMAEQYFSAMFGLFDNGTVTDMRDLPFCAKDQIISLSEYRVTTLSCKEKCRYKTTALSPGAELFLYDSCSLKPECDNPNFHQITDKMDSVVIHVTYSCDNKEQFHEMCGDSEALTTNTAHLIAGNKTRQFASCNCWVESENDTVFDVILKDVRLNAIEKNNRKCSNTVLQIQQTEFVCNETSPEYGSAFNKKFSETVVHQKSVKINIEMHDPIFQKVWIAVVAQQSFTLQCNGIAKPITTANQTVAKCGSHSDNQPLTDDSIRGDRGETIPIKTTIIIAVSVGCLSVAATAAIMIILHKLHWQRRAIVDDYIEPVYKRRHANQDSSTNISAEPNTLQQVDKSADSSSRQQGKTKWYMDVEVNGNLNPMGAEAYSEIKPSKYQSDVAYETSPNSNAVVYEQLQEDGEETKNEYSQLDSDK